jgi:hypothetical protein
LIRLLFVLAVLLSFAAFTVRPSSAANSTLSVVPATQTVNPGANFSIEVRQNSPVAVMGTQTDLEFNAGFVEVVDVVRGAAYDGPPPAAFLIGVAQGGMQQTKAQAIAEANTTGILQNVGLFWSVPGTGSVAAGETTFITVAMRAKNAGGTSALTLAGVEQLDTTANPNTVTANNGEVTVTGHTPTPTPTPCAECTPSPTATPTKVPVPTPTPSPTPVLEAFLSINPGSTTAPPGAEFNVSIMQQANVVTTGAQTDLTFDPAVIQVVSVTRGLAYQRAALIMGVVPEPPATPVPNADTIAGANVSGTLKNIATFYIPGSGTVPAGEAAFLTIKVRAVTDGRSALTLTNMEMLNEQGESLGVGANNGEIIVLTGAPHPGQGGAGALGAVRQPGVLPASGDATNGGRDLAPALMLAGFVAACAGSVVLLRSIRAKAK